MQEMTTGWPPKDQSSSEEALRSDVTKNSPATQAGPPPPWPPQKYELSLLYCYIVRITALNDTNPPFFSYGENVLHISLYFEDV